MSQQQRQQGAAGTAPAAVPAPKAARRPRVTRMRAMQTLEHRNCLRREGEVFEYHDLEGAKLPDDRIMVPCDSEVAEAPPPAPLKEAPSWTTAGFVKKAHQEAGAAQ